MLVVPEAFAAATRAREGAAGDAWVRALPALVDRWLTRWELAVDGPVRHGTVALVVPVRRPDGQIAVLKVSWVDEETRTEAVALARWGGAGAVALLASAPEDGALLLERLDADRSLEQLGEDEAVALAAAVLRRLHVAPPDGLVDVVDVARRWQATLLDEWVGLGRPGRRDLVERAVATCTELADAPGATRLLHGDFHYGNVLARLPPSAPQGWAALDPKPLVGDPEFDVLPLLRNRFDELAATGDATAACRRRLHAVTEAAGLDRERAAHWCLVRSVDDALLGEEQQAPRFAAIAWEIAAALA